MKIAGWCLALATSVAVAEVVQVDLSYPELKLSNGKIVQPALIRTFDTDANTVSIQSGNSISSVTLSWLPDEVVARLQQLAPPPKTAEQTKARERAASKRERNEKERAVRAEEQAAKSAEQSVKRATAEEARDQRVEAVVTKAAKKKATLYFKYEFSRGDGLTLTPEFELEQPEPVPGWTGRYRVLGKAYVRRYANQGSFQSTTREFEILVGLDAKGRAKTTELTLK